MRTERRTAAAAAATAAEHEVLTVAGLRKAFTTGHNLFGMPTKAVQAVDGVSLTLRRAETLAVVGESGAGKSTVGRLVLRLIDPDEGSITVLGSDVSKLSGRELRRMRARMTMIFQDPYKSLNPRRLIRHAVEEPLIAARLGTRAERHAKVRELIAGVGLSEDFLERFPYEMSGGQLQRVAIARALATDPEFIVCDEPVAALDMSTRAQVINLLRDIQRDREISYLFVSHDLSLVRVIAHRVAVMHRGKIVEEGPTAQIFEDPAHEYTRELLRAIPASHPRNRRFRPVPASHSVHGGAGEGLS